MRQWLWQPADSEDQEEDNLQRIFLAWLGRLIGWLGLTWLRLAGENFMVNK
jgi:hypothetical protein